MLDRSSSAAFGLVAEQYERIRASYDPEIVSWVVARLALRPGRVVVDVGAGTGKLTRLLVPTGARVLAVEPLAEMRVQLAAVAPNVDVLEGSAEELPLDDGSADAVTAAAAAHWFDLDRALPEFHRVLRPGRGLAILRNLRDLTHPLQAAVQEIIAEYVPTAAELDAWRPVLDSSPLFEPTGEIERAVDQLLDADGLVERVGTISYVVRLPDDERADVLERVHALGRAQPESPFAFRLRNGAYAYRRRDRV